MVEFNIPNIICHSVELPLQEEQLESLVRKWITPEQRSYATRRTESFVAGRFCAEQALAHLGHSLDQLPIAPSGRPMWPAHFTGSISHTKTLAVAAVSDKFLSIGIDVEELIEADRVERLSRTFINDEEKNFLELDRRFYGTLIFSAKEALFKLINPLAHEYFSFSHADLIQCDELRKTFTIELKSSNPKVMFYNQLYTGHYLIQGNNLVTILVL